MRYENIPCRRWWKYPHSSSTYIKNSAVYKRVMKRVGEAIKAGKSVDLKHTIVNPEYTKQGDPYDVISVTIEE